MGAPLNPYQVDRTKKFTFSGVDLQGEKATSVGTPAAGTDGANKNYVDAVANQLVWKKSVRFRTIGNIADLAAGAPLTVDGGTVVADDRILVPDQTDPIENGVYTVTTPGSGANGVWVRAEDFDEDAEVMSGATVNVTEGSIHAGQRYTVITPNPIEVGVTGIEWTQTGGGNDSPTHLAVVDPTVSDDLDAGYLVGQDWLNTLTGKIWKCRDNSSGAAVWTRYDTILIDNQAVPIGSADSNTVYTNATEGDEIVTEIHVVIPNTGITGNSVGDLEFNVGVNAPDYDDILSGILPGILVDNQVLVYRPESQLRLPATGLVQFVSVAGDSGLPGAYATVIVYTKAATY